MPTVVSTSSSNKRARVAKEERTSSTVTRQAIRPDNEDVTALEAARKYAHHAAARHDDATTNHAAAIARQADAEMILAEAKEAAKRANEVVNRAAAKVKETKAESDEALSFLGRVEESRMVINVDADEEAVDLSTTAPPQSTGIRIKGSIGLRGKYFGQLSEAGVPSGRGQVKWDYGDAYDGGWRNGHYHGEGSIISSDPDKKSVSKGWFVDGVRDGPFVIVCNDNSDGFTKLVVYSGGVISGDGVVFFQGESSALLLNNGVVTTMIDLAMAHQVASRLGLPGSYDL